MTAPQINYAAVFQDVPIPMMLLTPEFVMADVNQAYARKVGRRREDLVGRNVFDAFPENPSDPGATGVDNLTRSFRRVLDTGATDVMDLQKYDVEVPNRPGHYEARYWCPVNAPVRGPDGDVELIAQCVEEVTDRLRKFVSGLAADAVENGPG